MTTHGTFTPTPTRPHGDRLLGVLALVGVALIVTSAIVILGSRWDEFSTLVRMVVLGVGALALLAIAVGFATRPPGLQAIRRAEPHEPLELRKQTVAVLMAGGAGLMAATIAQLPTDPGFDPVTGFELGPPYLTAVAASTVGLVVAMVGAYLAPGVVSTLVVWILSMTSISLALEQVFWEANPEELGYRATIASCLAFSALGLAGATVLRRLLQPSLLVLCLGLGTWFLWATTTAAEGVIDPERELTPTQLSAENLTGNVGKASLIALLIVGLVMYVVRQQPWPWAVASAASLAALTAVVTTRTLGVATSLLITGILLVLLSAALTLWRRHPNAAAPPPDVDSVRAVQRTEG